MDDISPDRFVDALLGYQKTAALKAALALDLFSTVAGGAGSVEEIAAKTNASPRGIRILCDYLTTTGFLEKQGLSYRATPSTQIFLASSSPACVASIADFLAAPEMISLWLDDPASYVRNGGSRGLANVAPDNPVWVRFARAMVPFVAPLAESLAAHVSGWRPSPRRVLDVAAGHGLFGIRIAEKLSEADITAVDWQAVLEVARHNAEAAGIADRYLPVPGDAFEVDWGSGFDLILLTNFLHHFDSDACVQLLSKARSSLSAGGRTVAIEFVPNEDRVSPPFPATFSFVMLASTPHGDAYTAREFDEMGRAAGFADVTVEPMAPSPQSLIVFS